LEGETESGRWRAWAIAAALFVAATVLRFLLDPLLGERYPLGTYYVLVGVVGWYFGVAPAVVAAAGGYLLGNYFFMAPRGQWVGASPTDGIELFFYFAICASLVLLVHRVHQRQKRLDRALREQTEARDDLARSRHRFREVLDSMSDIVFTLRTDGSPDYINPRWGEFAGSPTADSRDFERLVPPEDLERLRAARAAALATGQPAGCEFRMRHRDGVLRWFMSRTVPIRDAGGVITGWVGTATDIDATRRAQQHLEISERRYRTVGEAFDFGMWSADATGDIGFVSPRLLQFLGLDLEAWKARGWKDVVEEPPARVEAMIAQWERCRRTGEDWEAEFDVRGADGSFRTIWSRGVALRATDGSIESWAGFNLDFSARRAAERAHARSREELELVTRLMTIGMVQGDREHRVVWANRAYGRWVDRSVEQLRGMSFADVVGPVGFAHLQPHFERALRGEAFEYEERVAFPALGERWIHAAFTPVVDRDGAVEGWVAVVNDVTHRRNLEDELREASRRKDEFIATLAHELRNPLAPIRYATQLFRPGTPAEMMIDARRMVDRQLAHMSRLLDDLLDVSRVTRGALELRREVVDLRALLETAVEAAQPLAAAAAHRLELHPGATPLPVDGDATRLLQIVGNLLNNAVRFTPRGGQITVEAGVEEQTAEGPQVVVRVRDNGIGIAPELLARIFEPFVQGERSPDTTAGLGIGLSLARQLAGLHGGRLEADSRGPGQGSEFTLRVPRASERPTIVRPIAAPERVAALGAASRRLLIVDDNVDAADSLAQMLRLAGFETRVAYDGRTALEIAELMQPDVALLDLGLPLLSGHDVARRLRAAPWGSDIRLIAVTGWGQEDDRAKSRDAGFDEHLTKPVDPEVLMNVILADRGGAASAARG
jgi:PAS domain S-box-containing protein